MDFFIKLKQLALLFGDGFVLYLSLFITLFFRYKEITEEIISLHFWPFTIIFASWLIIFYIGGLYELRSLKNDVEFNKKFWAVVAICGVLATIVFYFVPALLIAPKVNLFLFLAIFGLLGFLWRNLFNNLLGAGSPQNKILLIGYNQTAQELADYITGHPQLGYEIKFWMKEGLQDKELEHLAQVILANKINIVVVPAHIKKNSKAAKLIYKNLVLGIEVIDLACLYETVFRKIPLAELEEVWFLENITKRHRVYEIFKRPVEILLTVTFSIATLPLIILIATFIKIISSGPIIFSQQRTGKNDSEFTIYKFRTMRVDAEKDGPQWAKKDDKRILPLGSILRKSHLDEWPQLYNILKGDLSLVGPRPERPEFIKDLRQDIPYYDLRHLIRPGITGWAQINYRYGASIEDAYEKLQYDMYYLKNRSIILDILIILKTIKLLFTSAR